MFLQLHYVSERTETLREKDAVYVHAGMIASVCYYNTMDTRTKSSKIRLLGGGEMYPLKETPEEIVSMIDKMADRLSKAKKK